MEKSIKLLPKQEVACKFCGRIIERQRVKKGGSTCHDCRKQQKVDYTRRVREAKKK